MFSEARPGLQWGALLSVARGQSIRLQDTLPLCDPVNVSGCFGLTSCVCSGRTCPAARRRPSAAGTPLQTELEQKALERDQGSRQYWELRSYF